MLTLKLFNFSLEFLKKKDQDEYSLSLLEGENVSSACRNSKDFLCPICCSEEGMQNETI